VEARAEREGVVRALCFTQREARRPGQVGVGTVAPILRRLRERRIAAQGLDEFGLSRFALVEIARREPVLPGRDVGRVRRAGFLGLDAHQAVRGCGADVSERRSGAINAGATATEEG
jgi:hypothetical protein